jgi:hypothetical protein
MTAAHAFAMGYKIRYNDLNQSDFGPEDVPRPTKYNQHLTDAFNGGFELADSHRKQYDIVYNVHIKLDKENL